ncbi:alpha-amylase family glycosyl hydrolase [Palleronia sp. THAF1]|uniref:alpha-amylase family glycosyl hydrolase n=1 Tax=Palleronia sp. THAF1 TaxID=2587842 RepID=UPI000F51EA3C|nr:alpha-amylase family glycosyl hydrolase [Palleronia sp. THAF1]
MATRDWWQDGIIYQIYPRSFQDSTGSGTGDLNGIRQRLDYVEALGVDAIWISPIFPSPMADGGYDISDYTGIEPIFGTLSDFGALVEDAHARGLKVLLDFVPSHTSEEHPWFIDSRASKTAAKRDWYIWADPAADGGPPNNWISEFGGPAWTMDEATGQYYLHIYARQQPALNWRNPDVAAAMLDAMRVWYKRGVDGFRVDAVEHLTPDAQLRDNPANPDWDGTEPARALFRTFTSHQPDVFPHVRAMRKLAEEYGGRVLVGEAYGHLDEIMLYYGDQLDGFQLPFNFELLKADLHPRRLADYIRYYEGLIPKGGWPNWVMGNHDRPRIAGRVGLPMARLAQMLLLTLRGTPTLWQGDELGMVNEAVPDDMLQDPWAINNPGSGLGRDPVRIPMPWDDGEGRGFTTGAPFLPLSAVPSAAEQSEDPASMLSLVRALTDLRRKTPALRHGDWILDHADEAVLAYTRSVDGERIGVVLNMSDTDQPLPITGTPLLSTIPGRDVTALDTLQPAEGVIIRR